MSSPRASFRHLPRSMSLILCLIGFFSGAIAFTPFAQAADTKSDTDYPLVVFNAASLQRLRENAGLMFASAERADMTDFVDKWTAETLKETKGLDRSRPFGMMMYLNTDGFLRPLGIGYLPIENLDDALQTLAYGAGTITPVEGKPNRHDIQYNENFKLRTVYLNRYLYIVGPDGNETCLDWNFPDPEKLTSRLSTQYDLAISCLIKSIPIGLKTLALEGVKSQLIADLQQRDGEPESAYRLRRASGEGWVDVLDKVVNQGEEITIGGKIDPETKAGRIEFEVAGTNDSKLAKLFQNMAGKRSYFGNLMDNPSTFTMSVSWQLEENQRKLLFTYFEAAQRDLLKNVGPEMANELGKIVDPLFKNLLTSADVGHLDGLAQLVGSGEGNFALLGGVKLATSKKMPDQIAELLAFVKSNNSGEDASRTEVIERLELSADSIDSFPVHRLEISPPDEMGQRLFGETAYLYLYASPNALWAAFGGETALNSLREAVASVAAPPSQQQGKNRVPFLFVTHAKNWLPVNESSSPNAAKHNERMEASFESDNDAITIEIRPTDRGVRIRADFQSGFISLMGRGVTSGIENGFEMPGRRRPGGNRGNPGAATPPATTN